MIHIDATLLVSIVIALFAFLGFIIRYMGMGLKCLVELKATVETIKENQKEIKEDFKEIEKKVYNIN